MHFYGDFETAWKVFTLGEAFDWKIMPFAGGFMEQPECLMLDIATIHKFKRALEASRK